MPVAATNGITSYYETWGAGPPLVLLHNDALDLGVWQRLLSHLAGRWRVIAYDRRGHGQSEVPSPDAPYTVPVLAEDLRALLDALAVRSARLFGCSGGANAALAFTLAYPDRVSHLILAEPPVMGLRQQHPIETGGLTSEVMARTMREGGVEAGLEYWFRSVLPAAKARALLRGRYRSLLLSRPPWLLEAIIRAAEAFNPAARLPAVRQPVLLVQGGKTHPHFSSVLDVLEPLLPTARRLVLPGADHAGLLVPSGTLIEAVRSFLSDETSTG
ncbi:MAG TPA: alpha/beta hydrolase [Candidatus Methylomirabilis sp.]|nr:alpha/beta hydrolase [Candidatus Methylomirabilis sp.]